MDDLLTPVSTTYLKSKKEEEPFFTEVKPAKKIEPATQSTPVTSDDVALDVLKAQPDYESLISTLEYLVRASSLHVPNPKSAAIVQTLVTEIAPNYWALLSEGSGDGDSTDFQLFVQCLRSVTGINALISHLRALVQESKSGSREVTRSDISMHLGIFLDMMSTVLSGNDTIRAIWMTSSASLATEALRKVQSQALLSALTSGKLLSITGEAAALFGKDQLPTNAVWVTDGLEITKWIARNVAIWAKSQPDDTSTQFCSTMLQRAMSLGYPGKYFCHHHKSAALKSSKTISSS